MYRPTSVSANIITENCLTFCTKEAQTQKTGLSAKKVQKGASLDKLEKSRDKDTASSQDSTYTTYVNFSKRKFYTYHHSKRLLYVALDTSRMIKQYQAAMHCCRHIHIHESEQRMWRCKSKVCTNCSRIRTAKYIEKYLPLLQRWMGNAHLVVLTIRTMPESELLSVLKKMIDTLSRYSNTTRQRSKRGKGRPFKAIRTIEITYSVHRDEYHPHFNLIVPDKETAQAVIEYWLNAYPTQTDKNAQFMTLIDTSKGALSAMKEVFKYVTKHTAEDITGKQKSISINAMHTIYEAMRGLHCVNAYGITADDLKPIEAIDTICNEISVEAQNTKHAPMHTSDGAYQYDITHGNWFDHQTGEAYLHTATIDDKDLNTINRMVYRRIKKRKVVGGVTFSSIGIR
jgi:hypothetical protein